MGGTEINSKKWLESKEEGTGTNTAQKDWEFWKRRYRSDRCVCSSKLLEGSLLMTSLRWQLSLDLVANACNPSTWEVTGGPEVQSHFLLHIKFEASLKN